MSWGLILPSQVLVALSNQCTDKFRIFPRGRLNVFLINASYGQGICPQLDHLAEPHVEK
jgi:hypothetical protein